MAETERQASEPGLQASPGATEVQDHSTAHQESLSEPHANQGAVPSPEPEAPGTESQPLSTETQISLSEGQSASPESQTSPLAVQASSPELKASLAGKPLPPVPLGSSAESQALSPEPQGTPAESRSPSHVPQSSPSEVQPPSPPDPDSELKPQGSRQSPSAVPQGSPTKGSSAAQNSPVNKRLGSSPFNDTDVVLLVAGLVGSGRSTFINALLGQSRPNMKVGEDGSLLVCTKKVEHSIIELKDVQQCRKNYRLVLVDTPGFDDPEKPDAMVMQDILNWLRTSFPNEKHRAGVIYLQDLSEDRYNGFGESDLKALHTLQQRGWHQQLAIVTTKWNRMGQEEGERRHELMKHRWDRVLKEGTMLEKFAKDEDAWDLVSKFLLRLEECQEVDFVKDLAGMRRQRDRKAYSPPKSIVGVMERLFSLLGGGRRRK